MKFWIAFSFLSLIFGPCAAENVIKIGQSIALNGNYEATSRQIIVGAKAYIHSVNRSGGVNRQKIELVTLNDEFNPAKTESNLKELAADPSVLAFFYPRGTAQAQAAIKTAESQGIPLVGMLSGAEVLRKQYSPYVFHTKAGFSREAERMVTHLTQIGVNRIAFFGQDDGLGKEGADAVTKALSRFNLSLVSSSFIAVGSADVAEAVASIKKNAPQAVIVFAPAKPAGELVKEVKAAGLGTSFITYSGLDITLLSRELGDKSRGVSATQVAPYPFNPNLKIVADYQAHMKASAPDQPYSYASMDGYIAARVLVEGLRRAGNSPTRTKVKDALGSITTLDLGGYFIDYGKDRNIGSNWVDIVVASEKGKIQK